MEEDIYSLEVKESDMWIIEVALLEYSKNPISDVHGIGAKEIYERFKVLLIERSNNRLINSR